MPIKRRRGRMTKFSPDELDELKYGEGYEESLTEPDPTWARPGSPEKIDILMWRFANRKHLFHPLDAGGPLNQEDLIRGIRREFVGGVWRCLVDTQINNVRIKKHFGRDYNAAVKYLRDVKKSMGVCVGNEDL